RCLVFTRLYPFHIDVDRRGNGDAVLGGAPRQMRGVGARHQGFGWNATGVDTCATEQLSFYDSDFHPSFGEAGSERRSSLAGANDERVKSSGHKFSPLA